VCVNMMQKRKAIIETQGAIIAAHQHGKGSKTISKPLGVHHSLVRKIIYK